MIVKLDMDYHAMLFHQERFAADRQTLCFARGLKFPIVDNNRIDQQLFDRSNEKILVIQVIMNARFLTKIMV